MTTSQLNYQMRFCNSLIAMIIDHMDATSREADDAVWADFHHKLDRLTERYNYIHALWVESMRNGLGRV